MIYSIYPESVKATHSGEHFVSFPLRAIDMLILLFMDFFFLALRRFLRYNQCYSPIVYLLMDATLKGFFSSIVSMILIFKRQFLPDVLIFDKLDTKGMIIITMYLWVANTK